MKNNRCGISSTLLCGNALTGGFAMLLFHDEKNSYLLVDASEDVLKKFWNIYHSCRYDMEVSFLEYLRGNGVCVKKVSSKKVNSCGYKLSDIRLCLN